MYLRLFLYVLTIVPFLTKAQVKPENTQYSPLISTTSGNFFKDIAIIFNTRMGYDSFFKNEEHFKSQFSMNQFRFEIKGKIHEKVFFRFRNRYTKIAEPNSMDNFSKSVDFAHLIIETSPNCKLTVGKMIGDWGGYQLMLNPIEILCYNTIIENSDFFHLGVAYTYSIPNLKSKFNLQILNSRNTIFLDQFGANLPAEINPTKTPLVTVGNWKGCLFDGKIETSYSFSHYIDATNAYRNYITLGNKFKNKNLTLYYDFDFSQEDLDQKGIVTKIIKNQNTYLAQEVYYIENWLRAEYKIRPKINLLCTVMNHNSYWKGNTDPIKKDNLITTYGIIPSIEYTPILDFNMKIFLGYIGKKYNYTSYAESKFNATDYTTSQVSFGIIAPILLL